MRQWAILAISLAAVVGIVLPIVIIVVLFCSSQNSASDWATTSKEMGPFVALVAASLAALGVITNMQAQRDAAAKARDEQTRRLASALRGEVAMIWNILRKSDLEKGLSDLAKVLDHPHRLVAATIRIPDSLDRIFRHDPGSIGLLPVPVPEWTSRFYGLYTNISHDMDTISTVIAEDLSRGGAVANSAALAGVFQGTLNDLRQLNETAIWTIQALEKVAAGQVDLPPLPPDAR